MSRSWAKGGRRSEASIQKAVTDWARARGAVAIKLSVNRGFGTAGWPDYLFVYGGDTVYLEFKAEGERPTPLQAQRIKELQDAGAAAGWSDSVGHGKAFLITHLGLRE